MPATSSPYTPEFYQNCRAGMQASAKAIVPLVMDLLAPESVVDVGCGEGVWVKQFADCGVSRFLGIDGDYVDRDRLLIPKERFMSADLVAPLSLDDQFDLVVSLEVAEHLPETSARPFVESLTKLGQHVLFSAAIPHQAGTNHINLQWQEYWANIFQDFGYTPVDAIRAQVWDNDDVYFWYRQNLILYVQHDRLQASEKLKSAAATSNGMLSMVHPSLLNKIANADPSPEQIRRLGPRQLVRHLRKSVRHSVMSGLNLSGR